LALFALFIPFVGIGDRPAQIALFLYAILPILRNTVTGLDAVDPAVVESARGMGMGQMQQLTRIRIPLAWPVVVTGIRVSTQLITGVAAIAVLVGGSGLGTFIQRGLTSLGNPFSIERVWTGTVFIILLALVLDLVLGFIGRRTTSPGIR
jgi:osmoprotectant transport system permease protein